MFEKWARAMFEFKNLRTGILGAIAFALSFGAIQLASGHDRASSPSTNWDNNVNRAVKSDRIDKVAAFMPMRTYSIRPEALANTSVLIRLPLPRETENVVPAKDLIKKPVACEPVVSVLTEIAKRLQPGRCIT
jgi:hypothetical protein